MAASSSKRRHKVRRRADMSLLGGIRPPIAVLSALLLSLAGITALGLGKASQDSVPQAVLTSQQHFAEDGAVTMRASIDESVTDLTRTAGLFSAGDPVSPDAVLDKIGSVYQKWTGTAVVEIKSGRMLAARGENVPVIAVDTGKLAQKDGLSPRIVRLQNGESRLLAFALLSWPDRPQQLLIASNSLRFPGVSRGQFRSIAVVDTTGHILSRDGVQEPEQVKTDKQRADAKRAAKQLNAFAKTAAVKTGQHPLKAKEPGSGGFPGVSGSLRGNSVRGDRAVAGYAALAGPQPGEGTVATSLGLTVVAMVDVAEDPTRVAGPFFGLVAAAALLLIGALAVALLLGTVQRPLLKLFLESRRLTRGDLTRPVSVPRFGETARIGRALERLRRQLLGEPADGRDGTDAAGRPARRSRLGSRALIVVSGVLLLAWSAPMLLLFNRADSTVAVPEQVVSDQRERTHTISDRVRRALNEGHADLVSVASLVGNRTSPDDMKKVLERTRTEHQRYRSIYVRSADGAIQARAGEKPHALPAGTRSKPFSQPISVLNESGKEPTVAGYAEIPGRNGAMVIGEFRIDFINALLKRPGLGQVRVVDDEHRVIGGNTGYLAFDSLPKRLDELVSGTNQRVGMNAPAGAVVYRDGDGVQISAASPFAGGGAAKQLRWTVVSWQPASGLAIPEYSLQNRTVLAGLLGITAAVACLGWLYIVVVRPLRELAGQAESLADGDRRTVLFPHHHDEVGAVTRSLEIVRQQLQEQRRRDSAPLVGRN
ncbi:cache and HAMP domain-containing protein [Streptomyces sp. JV185]|uniref:cache domain-containing protein n=1 Tax=Streptomyces sp. JV185 TaxID=858638 RepID=UPI002E764E84|nr:cache and HAMP domain-containing protein [Streptomyces sp. JV185]MEE1769711.1 cache and HAMP domain-containing protein [Streptomyces sp. JV185]